MGEAETTTTTEQTAAEPRQITPAAAREYWRRNLRLIAGLMVIWFVVSFGAAIILARPLTNVFIGEIPVSFWFAQQGSIAVFVLIIFFYAWRMNRLDREYGVED